MIMMTRRRFERAVAEWQAGGIVDAATAARILAHEQQRPHHRMPGALVLLGGFAVALGLVALISANWNAIPVLVKLGVHLALTAGLGVAAWQRIPAADAIPAAPGLALEALLILLSASTLALIAHVGQSFNLQGGPAGLLGFWLALVTPFTLALARSGFHRWLWTVGLVAFIWVWLDDHGERLLEMRLLTTSAVVAGLLAYAAPIASRHGLLNDAWARHLRDCALAALVIGVSLGQFGWYLDGTETELREGAVDVLLGALAAAGGLALLTPLERPQPFRGAALAALIAAPLFGALPIVTAAFIGGADSMWAAAAGFCIVWLVIARLALAAGATGLFRLAVVLVALRLVIVFLEAAGGLMATGAGLVIGGLLLIGVGAATRNAIRWAEQRNAASRTDGEG